MRREQAILPSFYKIPNFISQGLLYDFSHQLISGDFMFQSFLEGERWSDLEDSLSAAENALLWREFGDITRRIHSTVGEHFGYPPHAQAFSSGLR
jgi:hypothetical protein